jgi:hypothetical protein
MESYLLNGDKPNVAGTRLRVLAHFQIVIKELAMNVSRNLRCFTFLLCALFTVAGALVISSPTLSETSAATPSQESGEKSLPPIGKPGDSPSRIGWSRFYSPGDDCAEAKVDIWLTRGVASYSISIPGVGVGGQRAAARVGGGEGATTILVGAKDCLISIRVERAPAGTTIDGN